MQAIIIMDTELRVLSVNEAYCAITGFSQDEVIGRLLPGLRPKEIPDDTGHRIAEAVRTGGRWEGTLVGCRRNGELYPQRLSLWPVISSDRTIAGLVAIFSDVSQALQWTGPSRNHAAG